MKRKNFANCRNGRGNVGVGCVCAGGADPGRDCRPVASVGWQHCDHAGQPDHLQPPPLLQSRRSGSEAHVVNDVPAISECRLEHAAERDRPLPRQCPRPSIGRKWHRLDHRHGIPHQDHTQAGRMEYAHRQARAHLLHARTDHARWIAAAGYRHRPEEPEVLYRRRGHRPGWRWLPCRDHHHRHGYGTRPACS